MELAAVRAAVSGLVDLLLPLRCAGCGVIGIAWCLECAADLGGLRRIERPLLRQGPPTFALGRYRDAARRAVLSYKESGRRDLAVPFGKALATGLRGICAGTGNWCLVPAPSRAVAARRRGGAHMARVAGHAAAALSTTGWRVSVLDCLLIGHGVRDSAGLGSAERVGNLAGRVLLCRGRNPPRDASVVLLDDVVTTGATVAACVRVLNSVGVEPVAALSLTATAGSTTG